MSGKPHDVPGRTGIYGASGTGKSTLAKAMVAAAGNVVVYDPLDEYAAACNLDRLLTARAVDAVLRRARREGRAVRFAFVPPRSAGRPQSLSWLCEHLLWFQSSRAAPRLLFLAEEMQLAYPVHNLPMDCQGFTDVALRGRHYNIDVVGVTQRPALIGTNFRGNESQSYFFRTHGARDLANATDTIGHGYRDRLRSLPTHCALHFAEGRISEHKNRLT